MGLPDTSSPSTFWSQPGGRAWDRCCCGRQKSACELAGSRAVGLETAVDNVAALSFYKRHGYSVIRTWPRYYSNGVDALVLKKELT